VAILLQHPFWVCGGSQWSEFELIDNPFCPASGLQKLTFWGSLSQRIRVLVKWRQPVDIQSKFHTDIGISLLNVPVLGVLNKVVSKVAPIHLHLPFSPLAHASLHPHILATTRASSRQARRVRGQDEYIMAPCYIISWYAKYYPSSDARILRSIL